MGRDDDLHRWETAGLIAAQQRSAIERFEQQRARQAGGRIPLAVEVLIYLGAAAIAGAVVALLAESWDELGLSGRVSMLGILSIGAGIAGFGLRGEGNMPLTRASSVLWLLSVGFLSLALLAITTDADPDRAWEGLLLVGIPSLALAAVYQVLRPRALQVFAALGAAVIVALGVSDLVVRELTMTGGGVALVVVGMAGGWGAFTERLRPVGAALALSGLTLLVGLWLPSFEDAGEWAEVLAIMVAAGMLWLSVRVRSTALLALGALGLFTFITSSVIRHFAETLGVPLALLFVGAALIGSAVLVARLRPLARATS